MITEGIRRLLYLVPNQPKTAQVEITNRCNFHCSMCPRIPLKVLPKDMDFKLYKEIIDRLKGIREVTLTGWGEPLLHPQLISMIKYAKNKGLKVSLTSNGSLLTGTLPQEILASGLDSIAFSIDNFGSTFNNRSTHPVTTQIKNVENFLTIVKNAKSKPRVVIQPTLHKSGEGDIRQIVKWAAGAGADLVNVNRLDVRFNQKLKRPTLSEEKEFVEKLEQTGRKYKIPTQFTPHIAFTGLARKVYQITAPFLHRRGNHCLRVYDYVYVNLAGNVTPCCSLPFWSVGNLFKSDLQTIWKSQKFQKFRQHDFQRKICGKCDVLELKQYA